MEQVLQLNNELFMVPEALFRCVGARAQPRRPFDWPARGRHQLSVRSPAPRCRPRLPPPPRPSDIGLQQAGLPEVVVQAANACPTGLAPLLYAQVVLTGGCVSLPGFVARFESELRALVPAELEVVVCAPGDPELTAWRGASGFACSENFWQCVKSREAYFEQGGGRNRGP